MNLRENLREWTNWDHAAYVYAVSLGIIPASKPFQGDLKDVFWTVNPIADALLQGLTELAKAGLLEQREEADVQFRWNPAFRGPWER